MLPAPETARTCTDPSGRRLLFRYSAHEASEYEQRAFERHMLGCDLCYEDFLAVWRVGEIVEGWEDDDLRGRTPEVREVDTASAEIVPPAARVAAPSREFLPALAWVAAGIVIGLLIGTCT